MPLLHAHTQALHRHGGGQMSAVGGSVARGFEAVRDAFAQAQAEDEGGAQLCVYRGGAKVVDLWAGNDKIRARPYGEQTLAMLMSCTKAAVALGAHVLAERGLLDFDAPVARYWPEFARHDKAQIRVRELLSHTAGLMGYDPETGIGAEQYLNWDQCVEALADMQPLWQPGTAIFYHAVTYGFLVGELIRRVSRQSFGQFFATEIAAPLQLELWIGLPSAEDSRFAAHFRPEGPVIGAQQWRALLAMRGVDLTSRTAKVLLQTVEAVDQFLIMANEEQRVRAAQIPAGNGIGNARSLAKMYASMIGTVDGVRLLTNQGVQRARAPQTDHLKLPAALAALATGDPQRFGLGFELPRGAEPMLGAGSFGHAGAGGRMAFAHPEHEVAVAYVCNNMLWDGLQGPDRRWIGWTAAIRDAIGA
jgi:CubicO group peptidase (beta-lactamase class C family)